MKPAQFCCGYNLGELGTNSITEYLLLQFGNLLCILIKEWILLKFFNLFFAENFACCEHFALSDVVIQKTSSSQQIYGENSLTLFHYITSNIGQTHQALLMHMEYV